MTRRNKSDAAGTAGTGMTEERHGVELTSVRRDAETTQHNYPKLEKDLADEISHMVREIRDEIEWLEEYSKTEIAKCKSEEDLSKLCRLREHLQKIKWEMRHKSYEFLGCDSFTWTTSNWMPPMPNPLRP
jgi:hypothetical protein